MKIEVTIDDILKGKKSSLNSCPIALAIKREFKINYGVLVYETYFGIVQKFDERYYDLPENARNFIQKYDTEKEVESFEFELDYDNPL